MNQQKFKEFIDSFEPGIFFDHDDELQNLTKAYWQTVITHSLADKSYSVQQVFGHESNVVLYRTKTTGVVSGWQTYVTNSDIDVLYYEITYTGNGINQAFDIPLPSGYQSLWSSNVVMVDKTWEFKLNHCCCNFGNNNIHIDFSSDVNQNYSIKFVLSSFNNIK